MKGVNQKCAMMAVHEKDRCVAKLIAKNSQGHAGLATNYQTPAMRMAKFIRKLYPEVRGMFEGLAPHMSFLMRLCFRICGYFQAC